MLLVLLHAVHVLLQAHQRLGVLGGVHAQQLGQPRPVGRILDDAQLDRAAKLLPECCVLL